MLFFHKAHKSFSNAHLAWNVIRTNRNTACPQNLLHLKKRIHFFKCFFYRSIFGKLTAKEKWFPIVIGSMVLYKPRKLDMVSDISYLVQLQTRFSLRFTAAMVCCRISTESFSIRLLTVLFDNVTIASLLATISPATTLHSSDARVVRASASEAELGLDSESSFRVGSNQ